jgi:hypothetical protein
VIPDIHSNPEPVSVRERIAAALRVGSRPTDAVFGRFINDFVTEIAHQKRFRDCKARIHEDYYNGEQWKKYDPSWPAIREEPAITFVMDAYSRIIDHAASAILAVDMRSEALAAGDSAEDRLSMDVVNAMLDDHHYRNNRAVEDRVAIISVLNGGDHFMRMSYDDKELVTIVLQPEEMEAFANILARHGHTDTVPVHHSKMADGRIRATYPIGSTREYHLSAHLVLPEAGPTRWEDVTRFAVVEYPSVRQARIEYSRFADLIRPMSIYNTRSPGSGSDWNSDWGFRQDQNSQTGSSFNEEAQRCRIVHYYEKTDGLGWDWTVRTGDHLEHGIHLERGLPKNPIVKMSYTPMGGNHTVWSNSLGGRIRPLAFTHNAILNQYLTYLSDSLKDILLLPEGPSKSGPITNRHRAVHRYDPRARHPPQYLSQNPTTLRIWLDAANVVLNMMWEAGGLGAATRGMAGDRMSGIAVQELTRNNQNPLQFAREIFGQSIVARDRIALDMAQQFYEIPRLVAMSGEYSETGVKIVSSTAITAGTGVHLVRKDTTTDSQDARRDLFVQLLRAGLGAPEMEPQRRGMLYYIATGKEYAVAPPEERQAEAQQIDEIRLIMEDQVHFAPPVMYPDGQVKKPHRLVVSETGEALMKPYQIHPIHIRVLCERLNGPGLSEYQRGLLEIHLQEHEGYLQQEKEIAQQQALQMEAEQSKARMTGQMATTLVAQQAKNAASAERVPFAPEQGKELAEEAG